MLRSSRNGGWDGLKGCGGACCNSKRLVRKAKHSVKQREKRQWKKENPS